MDSECHFQKIVIEGQVLQLNQDLVWEITIGYPPQYKVKTRKLPHLPKNLTLVTQHFKDFYFTFYLISLSVFNHYNPLFLSNPNIQTTITSVNLRISHFYEENSSD